VEFGRFLGCFILVAEEHGLGIPECMGMVVRVSVCITGDVDAVKEISISIVGISICHSSSVSRIGSRIVWLRGKVNVLFPECLDDCGDLILCCLSWFVRHDYLLVNLFGALQFNSRVTNALKFQDDYSSGILIFCVACVFCLVSCLYFRVGRSVGGLLFVLFVCLLSCWALPLGLSSLLLFPSRSHSERF